VLVGSTVATDLPFATLMQVPAGEIWRVADMKQRADGGLLVVATQVLLGSNPMPSKAVFLVAGGGGTVASVPTTGIAIGTPLAIADFGDRCVVALEQSFFSRNCLLQSLDLTGATAPFTVAQLVAFGSFGGFDADATGELVFGASFRVSS